MNLAGFYLIKGNFCARRDYTITGSGYLQMGNDNDYMLTEGNFCL